MDFFDTVVREVMTPRRRLVTIDATTPIADALAEFSASPYSRFPVTEDGEEIVGFVTDTSFNGQGSLWAAPETWREVLSANRPDAQLGPDVWQGLVVRGDGDDLPARIDAATNGATETFTISP